MKLFKAIHGGHLWLNHHGCALFSLPNQAKTTITHLSNLIFHDDVDGESGGESDDGGACDVSDVDDDAEEAPWVQGGRRQPSIDPRVGPSAQLMPLLLEPWVLSCFR